jgi:cytochrome c oxidase subunit 3
MHAVAAPSHGGHAHQEEGMSRGMMGMVLFIASEVMLFGGLFACYFFVRNQAETWPPEGIEHELSIPIAAVLSALLISSSITAHISILALRGGKQQAFRTFLLLTILLGLVFIGGQIYEWFTLMDEGLQAHSGVYGSTFYVITGFHGSHVIVGLLMLIAVLVRATWSDFTPKRHLFADASILYWHFVDVVWVFVFTILYISPKL